MEFIPQAIDSVGQVASWSFDLVKLVAGFIAGILIIRSVISQF